MKTSEIITCPAKGSELCLFSHAEVKILFTTELWTSFSALPLFIRFFFGFFALELVNNVVKCSALRFAIQARVKKTTSTFSNVSQVPKHIFTQRECFMCFSHKFSSFFIFLSFYFSAYIYIMKLSRYDFTCEFCE